jgi:hypothetical protein
VLYKVMVGRDEYLGTAEQVVLWMSRAEGAPSSGGAGGGPEAYMRGVRDRIARAGGEAEIDVTSAIGFLESLRDARLLRLEERRESSTERVEPREVLDEGPVAFGESLTLEDLESDVFPAADASPAGDWPAVDDEE